MLKDAPGLNIDVGRLRKPGDAGYIDLMVIAHLLLNRKNEVVNTLFLRQRTLAL